MEIQAGVRQRRADHWRRFQCPSRRKARAVFGGRATIPIAIVFVKDHVRHFAKNRLRNWTFPCVPLRRAAAIPPARLPWLLGVRALLPRSTRLRRGTDLRIWEEIQTIRNGGFLATDEFLGPGSALV
jgi:hypothetical protein